ncbi:MAG: zf-HC2 domain-containing protein [Candidatus Aminicenantes bacterium]|nr:zf-HC2 domain-containing protein [Candidatus Aminicenantes bacterium]
MIDCMKCLEGLSDYIYKQLPPQQASHIEAHLRICSPCQKEYEILSSTLTMLDKWEDIKAEPSSLVAIKARLQAEHQKRNHHLPSYIQVGVLVSIGIIVLNILLGVQGLIIPPLLAHLPAGWQPIQEAYIPLLLVGLLLSIGGILTLFSSPILIMKMITVRSIPTEQR